MGIIRNAKDALKQIITQPKRITHLNKIPVIKVQQKDMELVSCSNVIIKIETLKAKGYFTECRRHLPLKRYVYKLVDDYFDMVRTDDFAKADKKIVLNSICDKRCRRKVVKSCLEKASPGTNYAEFLQKNDGSLIGICTNQSDELQKLRIKKFVTSYLRPQIIQYDLHRFLQYGRYQTRLTNKVLATEKVAKLLGTEELIPHGEYVKLEIDGFPNRVLVGVFMEAARGMCAMDIPPEVRRQKLTGKIQRSFIRLNFLDIVCYDLDHTPNNYNVYMDQEGMLEGVHAYDNNDIGAFRLRKCINFVTYKRCAGILHDDGTINRPAIDVDIANRIMALQKGAVYSAIHRYVGLLQTEFTWKRIQQLQNAIALTQKTRPETFLEAHMFNEETLNKEVCGAYDKTYLISFLEDCKYRW